MTTNSQCPKCGSANPIIMQRVGSCRECDTGWDQPTWVLAVKRIRELEEREEKWKILYAMVEKWVPRAFCNIDKDPKIQKLLKELLSNSARSSST